MKDIKYKDDYALAHKYLCGDREAGYILYASVFDFVKFFIYSRTKSDNINEEDREDILSETLKTSIETLDRYSGTSKFCTFVIGIANNKIKEKIRSKGKIVSKEIHIENEIESIDIINLYSKDPLIILIDKEEREDLRDAINQLSDNHKQVIQLRMNGMKSKEIAKMTGQSADAVDSMYARALKSLKNIINNKK